MNYEGQICRAPMERSSYMLPVMVGCSYNQCKFCNLFRHLQYRELSFGQIEEELQRVQSAGGSPRQIFLGDGNAFGLKMNRLLEILELVHRYFPKCERINMDATVASIRAKSDEELKILADQGVSHLYLGIETGLNDVLIFMKKDHDLPQAYEAIQRLHQAGLIYDAHIMTGVAGHGRGMENAQALAKFLNETKPAHVVNFSMFVQNEVPLYEDVKSGAFCQADELECLQEERYLLELLDGGDKGMKYDGFHDFIEVRTRGTLPRDREKMLAHLDQEIARYTGKEKIYSRVYGQCPELYKCENDKEVWAV